MATTLEGRDSSGRFMKGHAHSHGNPFARQLFAMRQKLYAAVTDDDFTAIVTKMVELAKDGNVPATKLLVEHLCGRPHQSIHLTGADATSTDKMNVADVQLAVIEALADEPSAKLKVSRALKRLYEQAKTGGEE